jgi:hypothetical protein
MVRPMVYLTMTEQILDEFLAGAKACEHDVYRAR